MIAALLPGTEELVLPLRAKVDRVIIDRTNHYPAHWVYKKYDLEYALSEDFFTQKKKEFSKAFKREGIHC
ncbi:MAG: hypothetical protein ACOC6H_02595 [Thermoproteota archaeon]